MTCQYVKPLPGGERLIKGETAFADYLFHVSTDGKRLIEWSCTPKTPPKGDAPAKKCRDKKQAKPEPEPAFEAADATVVAERQSVCAGCQAHQVTERCLRDSCSRQLWAKQENSLERCSAGKWPG